MINIVMNAALAIVAWELGKKVIDLWRFPYRWTCPVCQFKTAANQLEVIDKVRTGHTHADLS